VKYTKDLVVLVADGDMEQALRGLLGRPQALGIRPIAYEIIRHPQRDPGCRQEGQRLLQPYRQQYRHALVVFDWEGSGGEATEPASLEQQVQQRLADAGWENDAAVVVLNPELESWVWSDSPQVARVLGWSESSDALRTWLTEKGFLKALETKPVRPKEAVEAVLRHARKPRSAAIYRELADKVSLQRCSDPAFAKLQSILREWFAATTPAD
jgi:hypothetical protein